MAKFRRGRYVRGAKRGVKGDIPIVFGTCNRPATWRRSNASWVAVVPGWGSLSEAVEVFDPNVDNGRPLWNP
jgi:hypothetical protein